MILYTRSWLDEYLYKLKPWQQSAYKEFSSNIIDSKNPYPCVPAIQGFKKDMLRFGFSSDPRKDEASEQLAALLKQYSEISRDTGNFASLIVFFDSSSIVNDQIKIATYRDIFWSLLNNLYQLDEEPWPVDIPKTPQNHAWEFCFAGEAFFVFCATPAHMDRKSRYSPHFLLAFQPRWVFDEINATTSFGQKLKDIIRKRLIDYDEIPPHPDLKWYGQKDNHEWKQYFLSDDRSSPSSCPFTALKKKIKNLRP